MSITPTRSSPSAELSLSSSRARSQRRVLRRPRKLLDVISSSPTTINNNIVINNDKDNDKSVNIVSSSTNSNYIQKETSYESTHPVLKKEHIHNVTVPSTANSTNILKNEASASFSSKEVNLSSSSSNRNNKDNRRSISTKKDAPLEPPLSSKESMPSSPSQLSSSLPYKEQQTQFINPPLFVKSNTNNMPSNSNVESNMSTVSGGSETNRIKARRSSEQMQSHEEQQESQEYYLPDNSLTQSTIDREMFSSINFSSALFVNNVVNKVLYPVIQKKRSVGSNNKRVASHGLSTLHSSPLTPLLKENNNSNSNNSFSLSSEPIDYRQVANQLSITMERAERQVAKLLHKEEAELWQMELRSRRIEIHEKRQLARIRLGLESTTSKLLSYEHRVHNAQSATTGIEQHLAQSNSRVERGKSIAQLLRFFKMFIAISPNTLNTILRKLSTARQAQRLATTAAWEAGQVSHYNPQYFSTPETRTSNRNRSRSSPTGSISMKEKLNSKTQDKMYNINGEEKITQTERKPINKEYRSNNESNNVVKGVDEDADRSTERRRSGSRPRPRVLRRQRRAEPVPLPSNSNSSNNMTSTNTSPQELYLQKSENNSHNNNNNNNTICNRSNHRSSSMPGSLAPHNNAELQEFEIEEREKEKANQEYDSNEISSLSMSESTSRLHPLEAEVMAAGLDRVFAMRSFTEAQVEWCRKLQLLSKELTGIVSNTNNLEVYSVWLKQELVADLFHLISCFNTFYEANQQTAIHLSYGRALLSTLELISRLYVILNPSMDSLVSVFFAHITNDLAVTLFSEYTPEPLPSQLPLPMSVPILPMSFFKEHTYNEYATAFQFIMRRIKRDAILVETIFGTSSVIRQQLLSKVTDGVVRPFITQQIKLAETHAESMLHAEALLSPRSKRRCGDRVADAIAYHSATEARLFELFQLYVEQLRELFDASEVEFLNKFTDLIFTDRAEYSSVKNSINSINGSGNNTKMNNNSSNSSSNSNMNNINVTNNREMELLQRYRVLIEEKYTRHLHPLPEEFFDLREAHMTKARECMDRIHEVCSRVTVYALPANVGHLVQNLLVSGMKMMAQYLGEELKKSYDSLRADRDNWRMKPKNEAELLRPSRPECQQCGFRMLLFVLSTLMSFSDLVSAICMPLLKTFPRLAQEVHDAQTRIFETIDHDAEKLLNMCTQAIIIKSLSILIHYQNRSDYLPKKPNKKDLLKRVLSNAGSNVGDGYANDANRVNKTKTISNININNNSITSMDSKESVVEDDYANAAAPPCTRACTLFCYYVTRQFEEAKEFIRLSNGQLPQRHTASELASRMNNKAGVNTNPNMMDYMSMLPNANQPMRMANTGNLNNTSDAAATTTITSLTPDQVALTYPNNSSDSNGVSLAKLLIEPLTNQSMAYYDSTINTVRARAQSMSYAQLLYAGSGPSSMVRTLGVCLYKGVSAHLKSLVANDRGALIYKQDVTAYKEAMNPLTSTPGLGGAVVEVLFSMLRQTSSLLLMPLDHIKAVKESGLLRIMPSEEKMRFIKIRQDVREAFRLIDS